MCHNHWLLTLQYVSQSLVTSLTICVTIIGLLALQHVSQSLVTGSAICFIIIGYWPNNMCHNHWLLALKYVLQPLVTLSLQYVSHTTHAY